MKKTAWTFRTAYAGAFDDEIYISAAADELEAFARYTTLYTWSPELAKIEKFDSPWIYKSENWLIPSVTGFFPKDTEDWWYCALSEEGDVLYTGGGYSTEKIIGAGVNSEDSVGWGYLSDIQQIGDNLYACGYSGQVYKRTPEKKWIHIDDGLLQKPEIPMDETIGLSVINGPSEDAIYAAGYLHTDWLPPKAFFFNGKFWSEIKLPEVAERIVNMYIESDNRIWMCGANGTLLCGNAKDGFKSLSTVNDNQLFTSITKFENKVYLSSNLGLFIYDPNNIEEGIKKVKTNLTPDIQDSNIVDCCKKILWSIGAKDIARFDGNKWERIQHPDNEIIK